jgi:hypothetical protein
VLLATPGELALGQLHADAGRAGFRVAAFHEPDLSGALTAIALEPAASRTVSKLPLAFGAPACPAPEPCRVTSSLREEVKP